MEIVFILSSVPIFILLLFPLIWIKDVRFVVGWVLVDLLITWQLGSIISSFAIEQWNILTTSFTVYPIFEAFEVGAISALSLVGVGALIFFLYFLAVCFIYALSDEIPRNRRIHYQQRVPLYYRMVEHEGTLLVPLQRELVRRLMEED